MTCHFPNMLLRFITSNPSVIHRSLCTDVTELRETRRGLAKSRNLWTYIENASVRICFFLHDNNGKHMATSKVISNALYVYVNKYMRKKLLSDTMKMNSLLFSRKIKTIMILLTPDKESLYVNDWSHDTSLDRSNFIWKWECQL